MTYSNTRFCNVLVLLPWILWCSLFCLAAIVLVVPGCGKNGADQPSAGVAQEDPVRDFEWGMTRLKRALKNFRPSVADGLSVSNRMQSELFPPNDNRPYYTARVTVTSDTSFLHKKRSLKKKEQPEAKEDESEIEDPQAEEDDLGEYVDIPGVGPQAPAVADVPIEPRSLESKSVFDLEYVEGHWQLTQTPEKKHEQLWFEYAFE